MWFSFVLTFSYYCGHIAIICKRKKIQQTQFNNDASSFCATVLFSEICVSLVLSRNMYYVSLCRQCDNFDLLPSPTPPLVIYEAVGVRVTLWVEYPWLYARLRYSVSLCTLSVLLAISVYISIAASLVYYMYLFRVCLFLFVHKCMLIFRLVCANCLRIYIGLHVFVRRPWESYSCEDE